MGRRKANLLLLSAGLIWGFAFIMQVKGLEYIGPFLFVGLRFLIATLALFPVALLEARRHRQQQEAAGDERAKVTLWPQAAELRAYVLIGTALFLGMAFQQLGLMSTSVTNSGFLTGLYVVFTPVFGLLLFRQWPHPIIWPASLLSFAGIFLLSGGQLSRLVTGDYLTIASAVCWALQVVLVARLVSTSNRIMALACTQFAVTGVLGVLAALAFEPVIWKNIAGALPILLFSGVIAGALAFTLQIVAQRHTSAPQAVLLMATEAPFAALFGYWLLGERVGLTGLIGCALILGAILLVELVPLFFTRKTQSVTYNQ